MSARAALDQMSLAQLAREFDRMVFCARDAGMWLFQYDPAFCAYCIQRFPVLAAQESKGSA
jgi:hypothetical protein